MNRSVKYILIISLPFIFIIGFFWNLFGPSYTKGQIADIFCSQLEEIYDRPCKAYDVKFSKPIGGNELYSANVKLKGIDHVFFVEGYDYEIHSLDPIWDIHYPLWEAEFEKEMTSFFKGQGFSKFTVGGVNLRFTDDMKIDYKSFPSLKEVRNKQPENFKEQYFTISLPYPFPSENKILEHQKVFSVIQALEQNHWSTYAIEIHYSDGVAWYFIQKEPGESLNIQKSEDMEQFIRVPEE